MARADWLLLFLATPARRGARSRSMEPLRIMKGMFLVSQRGQGELKDLYTFRAYDYGPFTPLVYTDLDALAAVGLVTQEAVAGRSWRMYRPTLEGVSRASDLALAFDPMSVETVDEAYDFVASRGFLKLLRDIYAEYPAYAVNTVVSDAVPNL